MRISNVAVVGGSICGLTTALLLRDAGYDVDLYERSPQPLSGFGTGIVVQPELVRYLLERRGVDLDDLSVPSTSMKYLDASTGQDRGRAPASWRFTSYDGIYKRLFEAFGADRYHLGKSLVGIDQNDGNVEMRFADGTDATADFVVGADGGMSVVRQRLTGLTPTYAGYVTWRGVVTRGSIPQSVWDYFDDAFTYGLLSDGHLIAYPIPPRDAGDEPRLNFQWYRNVAAGPALDELMTDSTGIRLPVSVHHQKLCPRQLAAFERDAAALTPEFATLVRAAENPFVTVVADADIERTVHGRIVLVGDAAITPRPHAAAGAAKAANDAWTLVDALGTTDDGRIERLQQWEQNQLAVGRAYLSKVRAMADTLQHGGDFPPGAPEYQFGLPQVPSTV
ncbi:FAD binding domain-containing protein [Rhodococcoides fascians]|uniref:FAD binding domain-containing protein n=1 Tax=Rhodococcoides fascians TaxID=1828 RepID=UPI00050CBD6C|nr:FAD-dependent monooxygenase [Rhodococcus fascians]